MGVSWAKGTFSVSSYYGVLAYEEVVAFPWKSVWVSGTLSKVAFFVWTAMLGCILTMDNLIRRGHILINWCCLCCGDAESVDHLLVHYLVTSRLWMLVVETFGLVWLGCSRIRLRQSCKVGWGVESGGGMEACVSLYSMVGLVRVE
ncbi:hypothetical protein CsSME_00015640 [Camellia sinensis var. sinensis]